MNILKERAKQTGYFFLNFLLTQEQRKTENEAFLGLGFFFVDVQLSV